jgi:hypothetical protein
MEKENIFEILKLKIEGKSECTFVTSLWCVGLNGQDLWFLDLRCVKDIEFWVIFLIENSAKTE